MNAESEGAVRFDRLNRWLTLTANLAVVAGIVFLALEIRQNNEMAILQADAINTGRVTALVDMVIADPELVELQIRNPSELDESEAERLRLLGMRLLMGFEDGWDAAQRGLSDLEELGRIARAIYNRPVLNYGGPFAWSEFRARADPGFIEWFEENVIEE